MFMGRRCLVVTVVGFMFVLFVSGSLAETAADAGKLIGEAQRLFFQGKTDEADASLKKVETMMSDAQKNNDQDSLTKLKLVDGRVKTLRKQIDTKLGKTAAPAPVAVQQEQPATTQAASQQALPSTVTTRLKKITEAVEQGHSWLEQDQKSSARNSHETAQRLMDEITQSYGTQISMEHPDIVAAKQSIAGLQSKLAEGDAKVAAEKEAAAQSAVQAKMTSDEWLVKLKPYAMGMGRPEYDPERYFVGSYTEEMEEMNKRMRIFGLVQAEMESYHASGPGENASDELAEIVRQLDYEMKTFQESCKTMANLNVDDAERDIDHLLTRIDEESKKVGTGDLPILMDKFTFENAKAKLDRAANLLGSDDARIVTVTGKYTTLLEKDAAIRKARVADTRMIGDKYTGSDTETLKKKAQDVVLAKNAGAKVLRTTLINDDWREENVVEWTDTTKSALRHRVTRYMAGQVAAKTGDETKIYTVHLAKDRRTDGSWGELQGHIMFTDPILEENVNK
ncbi:MAG TPA: hypothetical protein PKH07_07840 [bacterium]|nr:hypothetical protein [bacterium]